MLLKPDRVRSIRKSLNLTQRQLADLLGKCEPKTILLWERDGCAGTNALVLAYIERFGPPDVALSENPDD